MGNWQIMIKSALDFPQRAWGKVAEAQGNFVEAHRQGQGDQVFQPYAE